MSIYDHIIMYNRDEVRRASRSIDQMEARRRDKALLTFAFGSVAMTALSLLATFAIAGWLGVIF